MLQCKVCGTFLEGSDRHDKCIVHRQCSRNSPCPLDESQDEVYWSKVEAVRAAALGVRQASGAEPKKGKVTTGKGKKGGKGSLLRGVNPPGLKSKPKSVIRSQPGSQGPVVSESNIIVDPIAKQPIISESNVIVDPIANQPIDNSESNVCVDLIAKQPNSDTIAKEDVKGLSEANPASHLLSVNTGGVNPGVQTASIVDASFQQGFGAQNASYPTSSDVNQPPGSNIPRAFVSQDANRSICPSATGQTNVQEPGVTSLRSQSNTASHQAPGGFILRPAVSSDANMQVPRGVFSRGNTSLRPSGIEPQEYIPRTSMTGHQAPVVIQQPLSVINRGAAVDSVSVTLNGQRPSTGVFNPMNTMPHHQLASFNTGGIPPFQVGINSAAGAQYPFHGMDEASARVIQAQNSMWQGLCNPLFNPFMMAAQAGIQPFLAGTTTSSQSNTEAIRSEPISVTSVPIVTRQPTSTLSRTTASSATASTSRSIPPSRIVQSSRRNPPAVASDPYDQDSDSESGSDHGDTDVHSFVSTSDHTFDQDQFGMVDSLDHAESVSIQKLSELFAASRINPILQATCDEFGLQVEEEEEGDQSCSLRFGGVGVGRSDVDPIMCMPNDIYRERDSLAKSKWRPYANKVLLDAFKVPLSDHKALFTPPSMDKEVKDVLPGMSKGAKKVFQPSSFSPYWEKELYNLDVHLRLISRLASFQLTIVNYLLASLDKENVNEDSPSSLAATATLINDMTVQQLKSALSLSMRTVTLRRENVLAFLRKVYVNELPSGLRTLPFSEEFLFGSAFGKTVRSIAKKLKDKKALEVNLKPLSSSRGGGKGNQGQARKKAQSSQTSTATRGRSNARGRGRGGKRRGTSATPPAAAGGPPEAKKPRTGGKQQGF